jgi:hypothetical protein
MASRMAGAGLMIGVSPTALLPYGPIGSCVSTFSAMSSGTSIAVGTL